MGTEQLVNMFNRDEQSNNQSKQANQASKDAGYITATSNSYQRIIDNISEIWDESQYENEFNVNSFIDSLKKQYESKLKSYNFL